MREILFRGMQTKDNEWVVGFYQEYPIGYVYIQNSCADMFAVYPHTIGQYTGLRDRHNQKIFEGDIVEIDEHDTWVNGLYQVIYDEKNHCYALERNVEHHYSYFSFSNLNGFNETCKVLGNIHDNPELLEVN